MGGNQEKKNRAFATAASNVPQRYRCPVGLALRGLAPSRISSKCPPNTNWVSFMTELVDQAVVRGTGGGGAGGGGDPTNADVLSEIGSLVRICEEGWDVQTKVAAKNRRLTIRKATTGSQILLKLLELFSMREIKKWTTSEVLGCDETILREMMDCGRTSFLSFLVELFRAGTLPHLRRDEESRVLEQSDVNLNDLQFQLQGIEIPLDILREVLSFLKYDYCLLTSLGLASWNFYVLVLSTWPRIVVSKRRVFVIPKLVFRAAQSMYVCDGLAMKEFRYLFDSLSRDSLRVFEWIFPSTQKGGACPRRFQMLWTSVEKNGLLLALREMDLGGSYGFDDVGNWESFRLVEIAPNLEVVKMPGRVCWCEGLMRLRSLSVHSSILRLSNEPLKVLETIEAFTLHRKFPNPPHEFTSLFEAFFPRLREMSIEYGRLCDLELITRLSAPCFEKFDIVMHSTDCALRPSPELGSLANCLKLREFSVPYNLPLAFQLHLFHPILDQLSVVKLYVSDDDDVSDLAIIFPHLHHLKEFFIRWAHHGRLLFVGDFSLRNYGRRLSWDLFDEYQKRALHWSESIGPSFMHSLLSERSIDSFELTVKGHYNPDDAVESKARHIRHFRKFVDRLTVDLVSQYLGGKDEMMQYCFVESTPRKSQRRQELRLFWHRS